MSVIQVHCPDHEDCMRWIEMTKMDMNKLDRVIHRAALENEGTMKEIVHRDVSPEATGMTAASIETWLLMMTENIVSYAVGSRSRGHILRWLDRGRSWVYPVRARALRFWKGGKKIFAMYARPSPALNILYRSAQLVWSRLDQIVTEEV